MTETGCVSYEDAACCDGKLSGLYGDWKVKGWMGLLSPSRWFKINDYEGNQRFCKTVTISAGSCTPGLLIPRGTEDESQHVQANTPQETARNSIRDQPLKWPVCLSVSVLPLPAGSSSYRQRQWSSSTHQYSSSDRETGREVGCLCAASPNHPNMLRPVPGLRLTSAFQSAARHPEGGRGKERGRCGT